VSYFTAVIGRAGSGWRALDVDVEDVDSLDELSDLMRSASRSGEPVIAVLEREDEWFAFVRVDDDEDCRAFVSDLPAAESSHYGQLLGPVGDVELPEYADLRVPANGTTPGGEDPDDDPDDGPDDDLEPDAEVADPLAPGATTRVTAGEIGGKAVDGVEEDGDVLVHDSDGDLAEAAVDPDLPPLWAGDPGLLEDFGIEAADLVELLTARQDDPASAIADIGERCGFVDLLDALR
jgi:putative tRNA adenosine deaminase-associated protein